MNRKPYRFGFVLTTAAGNMTRYLNLRKYADQWGLDSANTAAYLCGHPEMIEHSKAILKRRGFTDKGAVKEEVYWVPAK